MKQHRKHNIGSSNYAKLKIQPWDVWLAWNLNPWDADIVKRICRTKPQQGMSAEDARIEDYRKIIHNCEERVSQLMDEIDAKRPSGVPYVPDPEDSLPGNPIKTDSLPEQGEDGDRIVRGEAMGRPSATKQILMLGAKDGDRIVRGEAMTNPNAPEQVLMLGAADDHWMVRREAMRNPNATEEVLLIGAKDKEDVVRETVMHNPSATEEVLMIGAKDGNARVREASMHNIGKNDVA